MKRYIFLAALILVVWNIVLTLNLVQLSKSSQESTPSVITHQSRSEFETDYTELIDLCRHKVVGVISSGSYDRISSGIIYGTSPEDKGVYVLTCYQVVSNAIHSDVGSVSVAFANNEIVNAEIVGYDNAADVAVLKVLPEFNVDLFTLGDSSKANEGEWCLAMSSRANNDYFNTFADGIVSGTSRVVRKDTDDDLIADYDLPLIQISTSVDASSSGGALVNMHGELIGMLNTAISSSSNESVAITSNELDRVAHQIIEQNEVHRLGLGMFCKDLKDFPLYLKSYYQIDLMLEKGMIITGVEENSLAYQLNFHVGDVLLAIDGTEFENADQYRDWLYSAETGMHLFKISRAGEEMQIQGNIE